MKNEQKNNKLFEMLKQHPSIAKWTGGGIGGAILLTILKMTTNFLEEVKLSNIIEWISKLKSLIQSHYVMSILIIIFVICMFVCIYKKINDKGKFNQKVLELFDTTVKQDNTISDIQVKDESNKINLSISIKRSNRKALEIVNNRSSIIRFPRNTETDSEVK